MKHVYYQVRNESPVYVRYRIQDTWGWSTGMTQRDDMEWEVGGEFRIGNSCTPVADSCQCMAKPMQYLKQNRHRYIEQSFGLCERGQGWDDLGEWH